MSEISSKRVAFITGGGSGMGLAVGRDLVKKGWNIAVIDLSSKTGEAAAQEHGGLFCQTDVTNYESCVAAFEKTWKTYGRIDFVYANAGAVGLKPFYKKEAKLPPPPPQTLDNDVNVVGVINTCYLGMHYMRQNKTPGGHIIITSSAAGIYPSYAIPLYTASKHSVVGLMRCLANVLIREGIRVNCTLPGAVKTPFMSEEDWKAFPDSMFTTVENIVAAVAQLMDDPTLNGKALEVSQGNFFYREAPEYCDAAQKAVCVAAGRFDPETMY